MNSSLWWARLGSNQRPADYESPRGASDRVRRYQSEFKASTHKSNASVVVRLVSSDWQSRLAVKSSNEIAAKS
jgi:hypothetical protein